MSNEVKAVSSLALLYAFRMLGLFMVLPILVLYGQDYHGATPFLLGLALGIYGLTQAALQIPLGLLSDFVGRKPIILLGLVLFAIGSVIAAFADSVLWLIIGRALQGSGAIASTIMALVSDVTSEQNRTKAMAAIGASIGVSFSLAMVVGPIIGAAGGLSAVFFVSAALSFIGVAIVVFLVPTPQNLSKNRDSAAVPTLVLNILKNKELARLDVGIFVLHALLMASFLALPVMIESTFNLPRQSHWQVYLAMLFLSMLVVLPLIIVAEKKQRIKSVFLGAVISLSFALFSLAFIPSGNMSFWLLVLLFFIAFNLLEACLPSLVSKLAPPGAKGTAMGVYSTSQFLGAFVGGAGGGVVLGFYDTEGLFIAGGALALFWLFVALPMKTPRHLTNMSVGFNSDSLQSADQVASFHAQLLSISGVKDALWVQEDGLLYLKLEKKSFDNHQLQSLLIEHA